MPKQIVKSQSFPHLDGNESFIYHEFIRRTVKTSPLHYMIEYFIIFSPDGMVVNLSNSPDSYYTTIHFSNMQLKDWLQ